MEKFDAYAESLLNQNIVSINEAMNNFENFSRMDQHRLLAHPTNGILEEFHDTHIIEIEIFRKMPRKYCGIIFGNEKFDPQVTPQSPYPIFRRVS